MLAIFTQTNNGSCTATPFHTVRNTLSTLKLKFTVSRPREPVFWASLLACSARLQPYAPVFLFYVGLCTNGVWWYAH